MCWRWTWHRITMNSTPWSSCCCSIKERWKWWTTRTYLKKEYLYWKKVAYIISLSIECLLLCTDSYMFLNCISIVSSAVYIYIYIYIYIFGKGKKAKLISPNWFFRHKLNNSKMSFIFMVRSSCMCLLSLLGCAPWIYSLWCLFQ